MVGNRNASPTDVTELARQADHLIGDDHSAFLADHMLIEPDDDRQPLNACEEFQSCEDCAEGVPRETERLMSARWMPPSVTSAVGAAYGASANRLIAALGTAAP